jgi:hypothetical protein
MIYNKFLDTELILLSIWLIMAVQLAFHLYQEIIIIRGINQFEYTQ